MLLEAVRAGDSSVRRSGRRPGVGVALACALAVALVAVACGQGAARSGPGGSGGMPDGDAGTGGSTDASSEDASSWDGSKQDGSNQDASSEDAPSDGSDDATSDAVADGPVDAPVDAPATDGGFPAAPTDMRDRIGIYAWGFDATSWPGSPDRLSWAAAKVAAAGSRTIRVYLGPQDIYQILPASDGGAFELAAAAASPAYHALFSNPAFDTILLTTYSASDNQSDWVNGYTAAQVAAERQEIAKLGAYLLETFPGKTFILLNWEGDNAIAPVAANPAAWDGYTAWINARAAGVVDARAVAAGASARLFSGVEFNLLRNLANNAPCDTSANKCVVSVVMPHVAVDYFSYSSWDSLLPNQTPASTATQLTADLTTALGWAAMGDASVTPARFIVGEFGAPREQPDLGECAATARIAAVVAAVPAWGASYGVFWQIIDNVPPAAPNVFVTGFGLYKTSGAPSLALQLFKTLYATQIPTLPSSPSCPTVNASGVVNAASPAMTAIDPTTALSMYGNGFTAAGNVVHVRETGQSWDVRAGSPAWFEGPKQVNFTLPGVGASQNALVFETDGDGVDSNGQVIQVGP
jgi:hypothetical protein